MHLAFVCNGFRIPDDIRGVPNWSLWLQAALVWIWSASLAATIIAYPTAPHADGPGPPDRGSPRSERPTTPQKGHLMSPNKQTVERYLSGFRAHNREQILSCLTDDIRWTVFGAFQIQGKAAYAEHITEPGMTGRPTLHVVRMIEEGDTVMAELRRGSRRRRHAASHGDGRSVRDARRTDLRAPSVRDPATRERSPLTAPA